MVDITLLVIVVAVGMLIPMSLKKAPILSLL